jgi:hypothetical protein
MELGNLNDRGERRVERDSYLFLFKGILITNQWKYQRHANATG